MAIEREEMLSHLRQIDEYEFEHFVADLWEGYGWETEVTSGSNDRGIDIVAEKRKPFHQKHFVQVKRWGSDNKVGGPDIRQYSSLRHGKSDVDAVVVVTTSSFSAQAKAEAEDLNVKLVDGPTLYGIISDSDAETLVDEYTGNGCPYCEDTFQDRSGLHQHLTDEHGKGKCPDCGDIFSDDAALNKHLRDQHEYIICSHCKATFPDESVLKDHLCDKHGHSECRYCGELFQAEFAIRKHFCEEHERSELTRIDQKRADLYAETDTQD